MAKPKKTITVSRDEWAALHDVAAAAEIYVDATNEDHMDDEIDDLIIETTHKLVEALDGLRKVQNGGGK